MSAPLRTPVKRTPVKDVNNTKRQRQDDEQSPTIPAYTMSLNDAVRMLMNQFAAHKTLIDDMRTEINTKIDTVKNTLESKLDAVTTDIQALRTECAVKFKDHDAALDALNGRIDDVAASVGNLANRDELIISGIPFLQGEDLLKHFKAICKQLGLDERLSSMVDIKRLKAGTLSDGDNGLVLVQFALKNQRDNFYSTYLRKHNLQLSHLGIDSAHRVYVNEKLTRSAQKLKAAAIRLKKAGKLFTVYTKLGVVYVRRVAGADPIVIVSEEQLNQLS
uniref:(northern house mosquito) hypothetical protein n=1 Tax=Culex pipiens TaxID=7175 RepID=A0A8D8ANP9_CULPI